MRKDYIYFIPQADGDMRSWSDNLGDKITILGPQYGLTAAEITEVETSCDLLSGALLRSEVKKNEQKEAVSYKEVIKKSEIKKILKLTAKIKLHPNYTENVGRELGIVGTSNPGAAKAVIRPVIKAVSYPTHVEIIFNKQNQTGVSIYSRLRGEKNWVKLINATQSPYRDERALKQEDVPEIREYAAMYWDNGVELGQYSDIAFTLFGISSH
jgi:hypothetical protein